MMVSRLIVRLEGALVLTADTYRRATNEALAEAGFAHVIGEEAFARAFGHEVTKERFLKYATSRLYPRKQTADLRTLFEVTHKHLRQIACDILEAERLTTTPGAIELIDAVSRQGGEIVVLTRLPVALARKVLQTATGKEVAEHCARLIREDTSGPVAAIMEAVSGADGRILVIDTCAEGLAAAQAVGVPAIAVLGHSELDNGIFGARTVVDSLLEIADEAPQDQPGLEQNQKLLAGIEALFVHDAVWSAKKPNAGMKVIDILKEKGDVVKSVNPTDTVQFLSRRLFQEKVGAMVVISHTGAVEGIVSERDFTRGLAEYGPSLLAMPVSNIMTRAVISCAPQDTLQTVAQIMTRRRIRHLPVSDGVKLIGLISIGDVLNHRLEEVQREANVLRDNTIEIR
ncbi:MAG: CBS domain-containing protein [Hyphomicrobium sp.]